MSASVVGPAWAALGWTREQGYDGWRLGWTATLDQLRGAFALQLTLGYLIVVTAIALAVAVRGRRPWRGLNPPALVLAAGSIAVIAVCTLTPRDGVRIGNKIQLIPFHTVREYWILQSPSQVAVFIGGNVLLFAPLGFFAGLALRRSFGRCVALCTLVSVTVEILQLAMASRTSDIDDVLTNTLGGSLGVLAAWAALRVVRAARARRWAHAPQT